MYIDFEARALTNNLYNLVHCDALDERRAFQ